MVIHAVILVMPSFQILEYKFVLENGKSNIRLSKHKTSRISTDWYVQLLTSTSSSLRPKGQNDFRGGQIPPCPYGNISVQSHIYL